jgi:hypothetical protein
MALLSKVSRAVRAYLISKGCGSVSDIFPYHSAVATRNLPNTTVDFLSTASPEPILTGNNRIIVALIIRGSVTVPDKEPNPDYAWVTHNARIDAHNEAMTQTDDDFETLKKTARDITAAGRALAVAADDTDAEVKRAANNADMEDFTLIEIHDAGFGAGKADEEGTYWEDVLLFSCLACESNVD